MALSNHINPKSLKKISSGVQEHQERFSEKEGQKVLENTSSYIDISQTKFNKSLFKSEELKGRSVKKFVSDELKIVNEKRKSELGLRAYRPDANVIGVGTLQISDDSLEKMGYDKSKKWSDQTDQARENVSIVYNAMVQNAVSKPDMYGKFLTATLHVDEGTPHVDYMTTGVDAERPTWSMREVLNGKEWRDEDGKRRFPPKGSKLRSLQDDLDTIFDEQAQNDFGLHRGETYSQKVDMAKNTRQVSKELDAERDLLNKRRKKVNADEKAVQARESAVKAREDKISTLEEQKRIEALRASQSLLDDAKKKADEIILKAIEKAERVANQIQSVHDKNVIDYMKRTWSKNVKGKTIYEVVDNNRMIDEFDERMREMGLGGPSKQKQREFGD